LKPLVSILIPAFNAEPWIADTLRSAIGQSWDRKEIIVVDDGSTDKTVSIAREFECENVRAFVQANSGAAAARNAAFSLSQGDYIQWLDADDLLHPDKIAKQIEALETRRGKRTLLSGAWGGFFFRHHRASFVPNALWSDLSSTDWLIRKMGGNLHMQTATWLVRRDVTESVGPWDTSLLVDDDGEYFCRVLLASDAVRFVPEARVYYRSTGPSSLSYMGESGEKLDSQWRSIQLHIEYLRSLEDSQRSRSASVKYLQNWLGIFHPERPDIVAQAQEMAEALGGRIAVPALSWKYAPIKTVFGWSRAKETQFRLRRMKWRVIGQWDRALSYLDRPKKGVG
jgi:glycosyltransferase involved in cell wall biosynthesis